MAQKKKETFDTLSSINVNDKTEKKGNLTYLSWAWAWAEVKKLYPTVQRKVYENENGCNYFTDGKSCWVKVGVTIQDLEHIDYLPVMDFRNKSILLENVTSMDINKAIQRSTTKALALHGLGLYIYAGEDLPEGYEPPAPVKPKLDTQRLNGALESIKNGNYTYDKLVDTFTLTPSQVKKAKKFIEDLMEQEQMDKEASYKESLEYVLDTKTYLTEDEN
tara:strand:+ start:1821 stop:2477 length:657 start_codon:yes stop_codon:yes gene_type:complete